MPQVAAAPKVIECWFEYHPGTLKEALKAGAKRPHRIFSSTDPRWDDETVFNEKKPKYGNLLVGTVTRVGEDFVEGSVNHKVPGGCHLTSQRYDKAREKMRLFETEGKFGSTMYADAVREAEDAKKRGVEQSERLTKAMETIAANLTKRESK